MTLYELVREMNLIQQYVIKCVGRTVYLRYVTFEDVKSVRQPLCVIILIIAIICNEIKKSYHQLERWLAYRTYDNYTVIKLPLKPSYYEVDHRMLATGIYFIVEFVEKEYMHDIILWNEHANLPSSVDRIQEVFDFALTFRPEDKNIHDLYRYAKNRLESGIECDFAPEESLYKEDTEFLVKLMKCRSRLWT